MRDDPFADITESEWLRKAHQAFQAQPLIDPERLAERVLARATQPPTPSRRRANLQGTRSWGRRYWGAMSMAAMALVASVVFLKSSRQSSIRRAQTYTTRTGQHMTIRLADGSRVTLAPRTILTTKAGFGVRYRTVALVGEAYFDVAATRGAPFEVQTHQVITRVLGTQFDIKRYPEDTSTQVAVLTGRVQSQSGRHEAVTLAQGMLGRFTDSTVSLTTLGTASSYTAWTGGQLDFQATPVPEALAVLERWYGVRFRIADSALRYASLSGRVDFQSTASALHALQVLLDVTMTYGQAGDTTIVTLHTRHGTLGVPARRESLPSQITDKEFGR